MNDAKSRQETLDRHLQIIVKACAELCPTRVAIILYGGFGRDEGSWFQDEHAAWRPYNDYDICIVSNTKASVSDVRSAEDRLAQEIDINWVDLSQLSTKELKRLRPSIRNYDFKNASMVIDGDETVLDLISEIVASKLPMKEAQILFFTRLYTLLRSLDERGLAVDLKSGGSRFFRNQMAKAILAVVDVLLLAKGAYHASYCERVERVAILFPEKKNFLDLSHWALAEKLRPRAPEMNSRDVRDMYESVHNYYFAEMYRALSLRFGKRVIGPRDVEICMKWLPVSLMKRLLWAVKFRGLRMEKQVSLLLAQNYIAAAWRTDGVDEAFLNRGIAHLRHVDCSVPEHMSWDEARIQTARLRMGDRS